MVRVQKNYIPDEEVDGGEYVQYLHWFFVDVETITSTNLYKENARKRVTHQRK